MHLFKRKQYLKLSMSIMPKNISINQKTSLE